MYGKAMNASPKSAEIQSHHARTAESSPIPKQPVNPMFREMAHHIRQSSDNHQEYAENVMQVVSESLALYSDRLEELDHGIKIDKEEIEMYNARIESKMQEQIHIKAQMDKLRKIFA